MIRVDGRRGRGGFVSGESQKRIVSGPLFTGHPSRVLMQRMTRIVYGTRSVSCSTALST